MKTQSLEFVAKFKCLQADCPDTCCKGWSMQVEDKTFEKYKSAGLENTVTYDGQNGEIRAMRRNSETDSCIKLENGICSIHAAFGPDMLSDACYFFPRILRRYNDNAFISASLSCPEITRLALTEPGTAVVEVTEPRQPQGLKDIDTGLNFEGALKTSQEFLNICHYDEPPEKIMLRIYAASLSLTRIAKPDWPNAAGFVLKTSVDRLAKADLQEKDQQHVLLTFAGIFHATKKKLQPRLAEIITQAENYLGVKIDWQSLSLAPALKTTAHKNNLDAILRKYLAAQLNFINYPFGGIGAALPEKARILAFKFALTKLFLQSLGHFDEANVIQAIQAPAKIIDHLAEPTLLLTLMDEFNWNNDARIAGLISG